MPQMAILQYWSAQRRREGRVGADRRYEEHYRFKRSIATPTHARDALPSPRSSRRSNVHPSMTRAMHALLLISDLSVRNRPCPSRPYLCDRDRRVSEYLNRPPIVVDDADQRLVDSSSRGTGQGGSALRLGSVRTGEIVEAFEADFWRRRAEETRSVAQAMSLPAAKRELLVIAEAYERLADRAQSVLRGAEVTGRYR
jgi:hypothetical protein